MTRIAIEPGSDFDVPAWRARSAEGLVPDVSPYGLERMADYGVQVTTLGAGGRATGLLGGLLDAGLDRARLDFAPLSRRLKGVDVLLTMHEKRGVPAVLASAPRGIPVMSGLVWLAGDPDVPSAAMRVLTHVLRRAGALWMYSTSQVELTAAWGVPRDRIHYVRFGVNSEWWTPGSEVDQELLVAAGTDRDRDYLSLLRAFQQLRTARQGLRLVIAGPTDLPATDGVETPGPVPHVQLRELYRRAAVVVAPTRFNHHVSAITSALEAMACARPLVTGRTPGFEDYVVAGETGDFYTPGDPAALAAILDGLLADRARADAMGTAARQAVLTSFNHDTLSEQLAAIARQVAR